MFEQTKLKFYRFLGAVLLVAMLSMSGVLYVSAHGGDGMLIHACVNNRNGAVRIVGASATCDASKETALDWGIQGPKGDKGDTGDVGPMGPQGPQGEPGTGSLPQAITQAFSFARITTTFPTFTPVGTISLPSGKWMISASINLNMSSVETSDQVIHLPEVFCEVSNAYGQRGVASPDFGSNLGGMVSVSGNKSTLSIQYLANPASTQNFTLQCAAADPTATVIVNGAFITAIQVSP